MLTITIFRDTIQSYQLQQILNKREVPEIKLVSLFLQSITKLISYKLNAIVLVLNLVANTGLYPFTCYVASLLTTCYNPK